MGAVPARGARRGPGVRKTSVALQVAGGAAVLGLLVTAGCAPAGDDGTKQSAPTSSASPPAGHADGRSGAPEALSVTYDGPGANRGYHRIHEVVIVSGTDHVRVDLEIAKFAPMRYVWDGRRLLVHDPEEYRPWILYEAPDEHPDVLANVTAYRIDPSSTEPTSVCPSAVPLGRKTILHRAAVGYRCGAVHTPTYDRASRSVWIDERTGLLLADPPITATAFTEDPVVTGSTFSTRPPAGSEVTVYAARRKPGGQARRAPDFSLERLDGGTARLADYRGRPLVLAFFSADLAYDPEGEECRRCTPALLTVQRETSGGADPAVLAVQGGDRGKPGHLLVPEGVHLPVANDPGFDVEHAYGLSERVAFAFIGSDGKVHQVIDGPGSDRQLRAAADRLR